MGNQDQIYREAGMLANFVDKSVALGCAIYDSYTPNKVSNVVNTSLDFALVLMRMVTQSRR